MQGNIIGQDISGNSSLLSNINIFAQPNEPSKKEGIWIKTAEKYRYEKVQFVEDFELTNPDYIKLGNIPYGFAYGSAVVIGTDVYLLGSNINIYNQNNYKYDTLTGSYTQLENIPYDFFANGSAVAIGTDIYLLGGTFSSNSQRNYKYNTLTGSYTQLENIPYEFSDGSAVAIGTDIYLLGSSDSSNRQNNYKYRIVTNTQNKTLVIEIKNQGLGLLLNKILEIYFSNAKIYDNNILQDYPTYYGNGEEWILLE